MSDFFKSMTNKLKERKIIVSGYLREINKKKKLIPNVLINIMIPQYMEIDAPKDAVVITASQIEMLHSLNIKTKQNALNQLEYDGILLMNATYEPGWASTKLCYRLYLGGYHNEQKLMVFLAVLFDFVSIQNRNNFFNTNNAEIPYIGHIIVNIIINDVNTDKLEIIHHHLSLSPNASTIYEGGEQIIYPPQKKVQSASKLINIKNNKNIECWIQIQIKYDENEWKKIQQK